MSLSDYTIIEAEISMDRKHFEHPLPREKPKTMRQTAQTTFPPYQP